MPLNPSPIEPKTSQSQHSIYGQPKSEQELKQEMKKMNHAMMRMGDYYYYATKRKNHPRQNAPSASIDSHYDTFQGLSWKVYLVPDDFDSQYNANTNQKILKRVPENYYDAIQKCIKPRRGTLMVTYTDFMSSLRQVTYGIDDDDYEEEEEEEEDQNEDNNNDTTDKTNKGKKESTQTKSLASKWIFSGILNGWPALTTLELISIEYKRGPLLHWNVHWSSTFTDATAATTSSHHLPITECNSNSALYTSSSSIVSSTFCFGSSFRKNGSSLHSISSSSSNTRAYKATFATTGSVAVAPTIPTYFGITKVRARLRAPTYTAHGWSPSSPGYVFWFEGNQTRKQPHIGGGCGDDDDRLLYGTSILHQWEMDRWKEWNPIQNEHNDGKHCSGKDDDDGGSIMDNKINNKIPPFPEQPQRTITSSPRCIRVHQISHRYATGNKQQLIRDYLTYHSIALLEWDHGRYCTVVELAYLGGVGGYNGRANWIDDKDAIPSSLYKAMPPEMIHPWKENQAEIRCYDMNVQSHSMFLMYMQKYTGKDLRFLDVQSTFSHDVRLTFCHREHIAQYLINYIQRIRSYSTLRRNCQTFAADLCAFLAGKKDVQPYHPINRGAYRNQTHTFLYDSSMYEEEGDEGHGNDG